jgi:hypothetical protein
MALELDYNRSLRTLRNRSPEQGAVTSTDALLGAYGRAATQQKLAEEESAMNIRGMKETVSNARADRRSARQDARLALPITVAGVGVNALGTYEQRQAAKERERQLQEEQDAWNSFGEILHNYWDEIEPRLRVEPQQWPGTANG